MTDRRQMVGMGPLLMLRCDRIPVVLTWLHQPLKALRSERGLQFIGLIQPVEVVLRD